MTENNKTHSICIWNNIAECNFCEIKGKLHCHSEKKYTLMFGATFFLYFLPAILGIIFSGFDMVVFSIAIGGLIGYWIFFFSFWESRILCSHCPQYANDDQKVLHCYANTGIPKTSSYHPSPISRSEKIQFIIGVIILIGYPLPFLIVGGKFILLSISIIGIVLWIIVLRFKICKICVNFSCPLNRVPKHLVDHFLKQNPEMKEAWEKNGYKID